MIKRKRTLTILLISGVAGLGAYQFWGEDNLGSITANPVRMSHLGLTGQPLFVFGDLYLDGRSNWLKRRFEQVRGDFRDATATVIDVSVHSVPFTDGEWLSELDEAMAEHRASTEGKTMETQVRFHVPDATAQQLLLYFACSKFKERLGESGEYTHEIFYRTSDMSKIDCVDHWPDLENNQLGSREAWRGGGLAQPFDVIYLNEVNSESGSYHLVYEMWADCGVEGSAQVRLAAGQFVLRQDDAGVNVHLTSFFRGQGFPSILKSIAIGRTKSFYENYVKLVLVDFPEWEADEEAVAWLKDAIP